MNRYDPIQITENVIDWDKDPFIKYQDLFKDTIDWAKDPMSHPTNQNKYFYSDGKTYYEQICKMLKLMSAFKESFAYIYENEEELHSAWENFVDNLSASAQYGEEVGVTLTWTEDSVNFDFTIPGGRDGTGIQSIVFNADYTMTITLTDGTVYNSPSLRGPQGETGATGAQGPQGPQGLQGPPGEGLEILDVYTTLSDLQTAHPTGSAGDAYQVGTSPNFTLYIWSTSQQAWVPAGALTSPDATTTTPLMDGTASTGSENAYARGDHRHPTDTSRASASDLTTVSENLLELTGDVSDMADVLGAVQTEIEDLSDIVQVSQSLIDQEFLYRETPADHDTIARLDSIKGNTVSFNQLVGTNTTSIILTNNHKFYTVVSGTKSIVSGTGQSLSVTGGTDMVMDLTLMGIDNLTTVAQVEEWLSSNIGNLPYYDYTQGMLIPFKGTGLKITGKNLLENEGNASGSNVTFTAQSDGTYKVSGKANSNSLVMLCDSIYLNIGSYKYVRSALNISEVRILGRKGASWEQVASGSGTSISFNTSADYSYYGIQVRVVDNNEYNDDFWQMIVLHEVSDFSYKPYISNTLSLPTLTYFPTGMKDCSQSSPVYDEMNLTIGKGYERVERVDLGSLTWIYRTEGSALAPYFYASFTGIKSVGNPARNKANILCGKYPTVVREATLFIDKTMCADGDVNALSQIQIKDSSYTDVNAFKQSLSGTYLYYEKVTPTEFDITDDSTYPVWNGGTEQILPVNGSTPGTAPMLADITYMSTDEAIQYLYDHISASVQAELDDLDERVTNTETSITNLETDLDNYCKIEITDLSHGTFPANGKMTASNLVTTVQGYKAVAIAGYKFYRLISDTEYNADGMMMSYIYCNPTTQYVNFHIENLTAVALENLRTRIYVLYLKDNGGN